MMMMLKDMVELLSPWHTAYSDSKVIPAVVTTAHLLALLFGGGLAIAADRTTLRLGRPGGSSQTTLLVELRAVHRPVLIALTVLFASGVLLTAADLETYAKAPMFWVKMGLVTLLLLNGVVLERTESSLRSLSSGIVPEARVSELWKRLRASAICSLGLWTATLIAGALLVNLT
jgi:hypothetical protein